MNNVNGTFKIMTFDRKLHDANYFTPIINREKSHQLEMFWLFYFDEINSIRIELKWKIIALENLIGISFSE